MSLFHLLTRKIWAQSLFKASKGGLELRHRHYLQSNECNIRALAKAISSIMAKVVMANVKMFCHLIWKKFCHLDRWIPSSNNYLLAVVKGSSECKKFCRSYLQMDIFCHFDICHTRRNSFCSVCRGWLSE